MTALAPSINRPTIAAAVHRHSAFSRQGLVERAFSFAFRDLVYAQIWEDPVIDLEALELRPDSVLVGIASGGCNLLSYLTEGPARIFGVDLNAAHVALVRLKLAALVESTDHADFYRFVGEANHRDNVARYDDVFSRTLDTATRSYWSARSWRGKRRIAAFENNIYRVGLLGRFITTAHAVARLYGVDPAGLAVYRDKSRMREAFERDVEPLFKKRLIRWLLDNPMSLYGLGIPPAQFHSLARSGDRMSEIVCARLRKLLCDFDLDSNYFAEQALTGRYRPGRPGALPPYLEPANYDFLRRRADRVTIEHTSMTAFLAAQPSGSLDRFVLLDAQDWMTPEQLNDLWTQITRTARPRSRVIFRTAHSDPLLPGRLRPELLQSWVYHEGRSADLFRRDRSAIYGGFHLYTRMP
jgi:S-adenosylmethionine-diacylglycerol 3-amino-3-carboxypropyl transferase